MEDTLNKTEQENLCKICDLILKMNPACIRHEEIHALQETLKRDSQSMHICERPQSGA